MAKKTEISVGVRTPKVTSSSATAYNKIRKQGRRKPQNVGKMPVARHSFKRKSDNSKNLNERLIAGKGGGRLSNQTQDDNLYGNWRGLCCFLNLGCCPYNKPVPTNPNPGPR